MTRPSASIKDLASQIEALSFEDRLELNRELAPKVENHMNLCLLSSMASSVSNGIFYMALPKEDIQKRVDRKRLWLLEDKARALSEDIMEYNKSTHKK